MAQIKPVDGSGSNEMKIRFESCGVVCPRPLGACRRLRVPKGRLRADKGVTGG